MDNSYYATDYLPEAAYLYMSGVEIMEIRPRSIKSKWVTFVFLNPPDAILKAWKTGDANGNLVVYYNALKHCRNKIAEISGGWNSD